MTTRDSHLAETALTYIDPRQTAGFLLGLRSRGIQSVAVLRALERIPRAAFAPPELAHLVYRDIALPLPCGQTMHDPLLVAQLVEALDVFPHHKVLEIGTGSGFVSAILSTLAEEITTMERYRTLHKQATQRFAALALRNIRARLGDGLSPFNEAGRYDRILVHGRLGDVPDTLAAALAPGGNIIATRHVHGAGGSAGEFLTRFSRGGPGQFSARSLFACRMPPLAAGLAKVL